MDVFGYSAERRAERALITEYEGDVDLVLDTLETASPAAALGILSLPDQIRGYGPVKQEAMAAHRSRRAALLKELTNKKAAALAAE